MRDSRRKQGVSEIAPVMSRRVSEEAEMLERFTEEAGSLRDCNTPVMSRRVSEEAEMLERFTEEARGVSEIDSHL